jgi:phosphoesterase RecJ-like protein
MNYPESQIILDEIKKADKILINCHTTPDADSVGSAFALNEVLKTYYEKDVTVICPENIPENTLFIKVGLTSEINFRVIDFNSFDFSNYDLLIALDSSSWDRVRGGGVKNKIDIKTIVIDHHFTNEGYGDVNLVDKTMSSTAELLYYIFDDWKIEKKPNEALLTGIISDTECFRTKDSDSRTMKVASDLMNFCSKDKIIQNLYQSNSMATIKSVGKILENISVDNEYSFCYTFLKFEEYLKNSTELFAKDIVADNFVNSLNKTNFGFVQLKKQKVCYMLVLDLEVNSIHQ